MDGQPRGPGPNSRSCRRVSTGGADLAAFVFLTQTYERAACAVSFEWRRESLLASPRLQSSSARGCSAVSPCANSWPSCDQPLLARIAAEYAKGRCLAVVTTDLDAQRAVVWDMGRIASYGTPAALELFRDVLTASARCPLCSADAHRRRGDGQTFQEMHVDRGRYIACVHAARGIPVERCPPSDR